MDTQYPGISRIKILDRARTQQLRSRHGNGAFSPISGGYFDVFGIPLVRGRALTDQDDSGAPAGAVINETMARQFWPDADPLTDRLTIAKGLRELEGPARQIVGIVGDVRASVLSREPPPTMYVPWAQLPDVHSTNLVGMLPLSWIVRTRGAPYALGEAIQRELQVGRRSLDRWSCNARMVAAGEKRISFSLQAAPGDRRQVSEVVLVSVSGRVRRIPTVSAPRTRTRSVVGVR